ncbi:hypothetical protein NS183_08625 [Microbacterium testaceum]|uniref:SdpI family protein n=1 Tax=Microbacterium testaceum TaxID=2033 RepID=UPI000734248F|nr:SdpI family protein [Microbacterium testaceum]KTS90554.1 hypothetical protein NS183_08625 [Microbacterium testaceum]
MIIAISTALPLLVAGLLVLWTAYRASRRTLPMNFWIGVRTSATVRSEEAWTVGHAAAATAFSVGGIGLIVAAAAAVFAGEEFAIYAAMAGCAWIVVWIIVASAAAGKAAGQVSQKP